MKKRSMLLLALAVSMVAILAVGGTLAYFTDTDTAKNTFVVGNIKIKLNEYNATPDQTQTKPEDMSQEEWDKGLQDDDYRNWLADQEDKGQLLMPGTEIPKYVVVKNVGKRDAICWIEVHVPAILDETGSLHICYDDWELNDKFNNGNAFLHIKSLGKTADGQYVRYAIWGESDDKTAQTEAGPNDATIQLMHGIKMDEAVKQVIAADGSISWILADGQTPYDGSWDVIVKAIGFQKDNVDTIENAMNSYYNGDSMTIPTT